jgi:GntR family transcriptional regulator
MAQGISRVVESCGAAPGNRLVHFTQMAASQEMAKRLGIAKGDELIEFRRLWTVD